MSDNINDLASGKPFETIDIIDDKHKPDYHEKDIDDYKGKWTIYGLLRDPKIAAISPETFEKKADAEKQITVMWAIGITLNSDILVLPKDIILLIPMPKT